MSSIVVVDPKNPGISTILRAAEVLVAGGLIAYPTDTVYGLGANALDPKAVLKVFEIKRRPLEQPLPVAVSGLKMAEELAYVDDKARRLMEFFWPGALTIVLRRRPRVPSVVTGGGSGVGLREPDHRVPLSIIEMSGLPLTATSANRHGVAPCVEVRDVVSQFNGEVDLFIDGGRGRGEVSTVIDLVTAPPAILRRGPVTRGMIERVIGFVEEP